MGGEETFLLLALKRAGQGRTVLLSVLRVVFWDARTWERVFVWAEARVANATGRRVLKCILPEEVLNSNQKSQRRNRIKNRK